MQSDRCFGAPWAGVPWPTWRARVGELWRRYQSSLATIVLVGCEHSLQPTASLGIGEAEIERGQKHHFSRMLEGLIDRHAIDLIGEETRAGEETIAQKLADAHGCEYVNIDAVKQERRKLGIPTDYLQPDAQYPSGQVARWQVRREQFMYEKLSRRRGPSRNALVICGWSHLDRLAGLFREEGPDPRLCDVRQTKWFVNRWR